MLPEADWNTVEGYDVDSTTQCRIISVHNFTKYMAEIITSEARDVGRGEQWSTQHLESLKSVDFALSNICAMTLDKYGTDKVFVHFECISTNITGTPLTMYLVRVKLSVEGELEDTEITVGAHHHEALNVTEAAIAALDRLGGTVTGLLDFLTKESGTVQ